MKAKNSAIIKSILCLLKAYKTEMGLPETDLRQSTLKSLTYLISQTIRHYVLPKSHYHLSQAAYERWEELSDEDIMQKHFQDHVFCDKLEGTSRQYPLFVGASKKGILTEITEEGFSFRQMFHEDHIVPVSMIFEQMILMDKMDAEKVSALLNKMHICTILKEENNRIGRTRDRCLDYRKTINKVYTPAGITLVL